MRFPGLAGDPMISIFHVYKGFRLVEVRLWHMPASEVRKKLAVATRLNRLMTVCQMSEPQAETHFCRKIRGPSADQRGYRTRTLLSKFRARTPRRLQVK
jgi:hypothetical protein